jgi:adenosylhomocysteinase
MRSNLEEYIRRRQKPYLLAEGRLVNLACRRTPVRSYGHVFANQSLCSEYLAKTAVADKVYMVPREIDENIAELKLRSMGVKIDELTEEQKKYLSTWEMGTT